MDLPEEKEEMVKIGRRKKTKEEKKSAHLPVVHLQLEEVAQEWFWRRARSRDDGNTAREEYYAAAE